MARFSVGRVLREPVLQRGLFLNRGKAALTNPVPMQNMDNETSIVFDAVEGKIVAVRTAPDAMMLAAP
ncbi:MAG TPA: hypothetical protein PLD10_10530 [Rhodopila sp.]|nr:hypothetical protein [Rhodopila sp.]